MAGATLILMALGRRIGLRERLLIGEALSVQRLGGIVQLVRRLAVFTILCEGIGALVLFGRFLGENEPLLAFWRAVFHAVSAFNNAGFDLTTDGSSLIAYQRDPLVLLPVAFLIILGGLSFVVVADVVNVRRFSRLSLDTKLVLTATGILLLVGTFIILLTEYGNPATLGGMPVGYKVLNAFFYSVTTRTAGFSTFDVGAAADFALFFTIFLMFIGASAGSTAGGIKINSFSIIVATIWSSIRGRQYASAFKKELKTDQVYRALAVMVLAATTVVIVTLILSVTEQFRFLPVLFETVSAFGTVGLSTGITADLSLSAASFIIIIMLIGRLGPLSLALLLVQRQQVARYRFPEEMVRIG